MDGIDIKEKLENLIKSTARPVVIFDLDGTLFDVNYRHLEILRRFANLSEIVQEFPSQVAIIKQIKPQDFHYSIEATLNAQGIDRYSEHSARLVHLCEEFWFKHFFTNEILAFDMPVPKVKECVEWFYKKAVHIVYLSGRDIPNMSEGTIAALKKHTFPFDQKTTLELKPKYGEDDLLFKKHALEDIAHLGEVVATFDNEPANVQLFLDAFPNALNFHYDSLYAKKLQLIGKSLYVIKSFQEILDR